MSTTTTTNTTSNGDSGKASFIRQPRHERERIARIQQHSRRLQSELERVRQNDFSLTNLFFGALDECASPGLCLSVGNVLMTSKYLRTFTLGPIELKKISVKALATGIGEAKLESLVLANVTAAGTTPKESKRIWQTLFQGLQSSQTIRELHMTQLGDDMEGIISLGDALPYIPSLRKLTLHVSALDEAAADALAMGIGQSKLESLSLMESRQEQHHQPESDETHRIWQAFCKGLHSVQELHLALIPKQGVMEVANALPQLEALHKFTFSSLHLTEVGSQALAKGIAQSKKLKSLTIGCVKPTDGKEQIWPPLFEGCQSIEELELPYLQKGEVASFGMALPSMKSLRKLTLSNFALTEKGARVLSEGIKESNLTSLQLNSPVDVTNKHKLARLILYQGINSSKSIRELALSAFPVDELAHFQKVLQSIQTLKVSNFQQSFLFYVLLRDLLEKSTSLKNLELTHGELGKNGIVLLTQGLGLSTSIERLVIESCGGVDNRGVDMLFADGLRNNASLKELALNWCAIGNEGVEYLIHNWRSDSPLESLSLRDNAIGATGASLLVRAIREHPAMRTLDVSGNLIGYDGLRMVAEALVDQNHLKQVFLKGCSTWRGDDEVAQKTARCRAASMLLQRVMQNLNLQHLVVAGNGFIPLFEHGIEFYAGLNRTGRNLILSDNGLAAALWAHILANCQQQPNVAASLTFYYLQEQPNLVQNHPGTAKGIVFA